MQSTDAELPSPPLTISFPLDPSEGYPSNLAASFPAKPGVLVFESDGSALAIFATANLRRMIEAKLNPAPDEGLGSRPRVNYRGLTHRVHACIVGSAFEADWAYLQWARKLMPNSYRVMLDRWQAWFVWCDPSAAHPQWLKTAHPHRLQHQRVALGPFPEKHAAGKYIELLEDAFDLCRYYHILVQAPHATACAYKEMGRCPAPCDGSISLDQYRGQFAQAIEFGSTAILTWRSAIEQKMQNASKSLDFEAAQKFQRLLTSTKSATRAEFAHVNRLEDFKFVAMAQSERRGWIRVFIVFGGWIEPIVDLEIDAPAEAFEAVAQAIHDQARTSKACFDELGIENIAMTCWHLFRPRAERPRIEFVRFNSQLDGTALQAAATKLSRKSTGEEQPIADRSFGEM